MNKDFRRNVLATITQLLKKIAHLKHLENLELRQSCSHGMQIDVQLLKSDLMLILNQNFYLQCKLAEKNIAVAELQKKYLQLQESSALKIRMANQKYKKLLHSLQYQHFLQKLSQTQEQRAKQTAFFIQQQFKGYSSIRDQQLPTAKKPINFRKVRSSLDDKKTLHKNSRKQQALDKEFPIIQRFDKEATLFQGVKSQQLNKLAQSQRAQRDSSNQFAKIQDKNTIKSRVDNAFGLSHGEQGQSCKQYQLKQLVNQQFKVLFMKDRYFCTDLQ